MRATAFILLHVLILSLSCMAQNAPVVDPPELAAQREEYIRNLQRASIPLLQQYLRTLDGLKGQFVRDGRLGPLTAIQKEHDKVQAELDTATNAIDRSKTASLQMQILSATYGQLDKKPRAEDVTDQLRKAIRAGQESLKLNNGLTGGKDPAPFAHKQTKIVYSVNGERKEKVFSEGYNLKFTEDLN